MNNKIKKIISALVISCTIVGQVAVPTVADAYTKSSAAKTTYSTKATSVSKAKSVSKIKSQINSTYRKAKSISGRSNFAHQCSLYVYSQLRALKIYQVPDTYWNGSGWYYNLRSGAKTSTGYTQKKYSGKTLSLIHI